MMRLTKKQFEYYLYQYKLNRTIYSYELIDVDDTYEYVYQIERNYKTYLLYSSISKSTDESRDYGTDRVRCVLVDNGKYKNVFECNRTKGIYQNIEKKLRCLKS